MTNNVKDITVILPVHELNDVTEQLFKNAITSVFEQVETPNLLVVATPSVYDKVITLIGNHNHCEVIKNEGESDFSSQINYGVNNINTTWFSILEYDDEYANIWFKNVVKYQNAYPDVDLFLPIIIDVNDDNQFVGFSNEAVWANSFSDVLGVLDNNAVLTYQGFNIDGMVMKKETYLNNGGLKKNLKLTFLYEFLLRMTFKDVKAMVIPKFGYKHTNQRVDSLFYNLQNEMNPVEANWWLSQAKKEYYFDKDREITYQD
jgi:hypothetical protein